MWKEVQLEEILGARMLAKDRTVLPTITGDWGVGVGMRGGIIYEVFGLKNGMKCPDCPALFHRWWPVFPKYLSSYITCNLGFIHILLLLKQLFNIATPKGIQRKIHKMRNLVDTVVPDTRGGNEINWKV